MSNIVTKKEEMDLVLNNPQLKEDYGRKLLLNSERLFQLAKNNREDISLSAFLCITSIDEFSKFIMLDNKEYREKINDLRNHKKKYEAVFSLLENQDPEFKQLINSIDIDVGNQNSLGDGLLVLRNSCLYVELVKGDRHLEPRLPNEHIHVNEGLLKKLLDYREKLPEIYEEYKKSKATGNEIDWAAILKTIAIVVGAGALIGLGALALSKMVKE